MKGSRARSVKPLFKLMALVMFTGSVAAVDLMATHFGNAVVTGRPEGMLNHSPELAEPTETHQPTIQIAILLDTSNSMDGLINQTREQLWTLVNELGKVKKNGRRPVLEVAVFEYGNSQLSAWTGYVRQVLPLSSDLDRVSEALFSLQTSGGDEYCGQVISAAINQLQWSQVRDDMRLIFIAGNESFAQGPVRYQSAIEMARGRDIQINTLFAGEHQQGIESLWKNAAILAGGQYISIDHNQAIVHLKAPQDEQMAQLNQALNQTYIPYGKEGQKAIGRQRAQDQQSSRVSVGLLASRARAKASAAYKNEQWDLVDAVAGGKLEIAELKDEELPASLAKLPTEQRAAYIEEKKRERERIKEQITVLSEAREAYIKKAREPLTDKAGPTMVEALLQSVRQAAQSKHYELSQPSQ